MLAALPPKQLWALFLDRTAFAHRTDTGPQNYGSLKRLLDDVRRRGYAEEDGDVVAGLASVAVSVLDHTGWPPPRSPSRPRPPLQPRPASLTPPTAGPPSPPPLDARRTPRPPLSPSSDERFRRKLS
ncbi:IclR family transcriptional regulator C-terminal domain-containing protein [Herbiconiux sp.]|uniref:IclR family transcriptional regulator domain-containing protein n=1 Tax=Herbiconiux sp. TaxID=1871186 RepID=UPI0025C1CA82|nr:IclR family transcriptional regulator C-terminal domain-containing protein [Herbiconiux sp.]